MCHACSCMLVQKHWHWFVKIALKQIMKCGGLKMGLHTPWMNGHVDDVVYNGDAGSHYIYFTSDCIADYIANLWKRNTFAVEVMRLFILGSRVSPTLQYVWRCGRKPWLEEYVCWQHQCWCWFVFCASEPREVERPTVLQRVRPLLSLNSTRNVLLLPPAPLLTSPLLL